MNLKKNILLVTVPIAIFLMVVCVAIVGCSNTNGVSKDSWPTDVPRHTEGLDYYTLDELKDVANWLSAHCEDDGFSDSIVYTTFQTFMNQGQIWFSNSNGQILCPAKDVAKSADVSKCNQEYKLSFNGVSRDIDNFLFLKIVGICEDEKAEGGKAGLTFEPISILPIASEYGEPNSWWGNSIVRQNLQEGGLIYSQLDTANHAFTNKIVKVNKYSQETRAPSAGSEPEKKKTVDSFFLPSASETFPLNYANTDVKYLTDGGEGNQYSYFKLGNFDLKSNNRDKNYFCPYYKTNSGNTATSTTVVNPYVMSDKTLSRSVYTVFPSYSNVSPSLSDPLKIGIFALCGDTFTHYDLGATESSFLSTDKTFKTKYAFEVAPMFCF